jgi:hypothetical protein
MGAPGAPICCCAAASPASCRSSFVGSSAVGIIADGAGSVGGGAALTAANDGAGRLVGMMRMRSNCEALGSSVARRAIM